VRREPLIDALRAFALAGILQVNIQSFVWGAGEPLGYFSDESRDIDVIVHWFVSALVSSKFIALFALLFGVGCALQFRALRRLGLSFPAAKSTYRRRLAFLLLIGVLHGVLLYFGDVLTLYALCGFLLLRHVGQRPARLARAVRRWWIAFAIVTLAGGLLADIVGRYAMSGPYAGQIDPQSISEGSLQAFEIFTTGTYAEQLPMRAAEYLELQTSVLIFAVPQIMALFTLGLLAGRLGWLRRPERYALVWRQALYVGLAAAPLALFGAWLSTTSLLVTPGTPSIFGSTLTTLSTPLAAAYVALIVRARRRAFARAIAWLAPAGHMPLTNYVLQSVFMGALLSGWGAGLGARWNHAALALVGLLIVVAQWLLSRMWIRRFGQGPLEAAWRRATYGRRPDRTLPAAPPG
jgi:uncharacterized protein